MQGKGYYIPQTSWIDFFNPDAAAYYWENFNKRLLKPYGIDAWWLDATEPENDDLLGRKVWNQTVPGEVYRNVYPLLVNRTVYEGSRREMPDRRVMLLTRSGFPGMQRYATATWSGVWGMIGKRFAGRLWAVWAWWCRDSLGGHTMQAVSSVPGKASIPIRLTTNVSCAGCRRAYSCP